MRRILLVMSASSLFVPSDPFAGTPFSSPYIAAVDTLRIACALAGAVALLLLVQLAVNSENRDFPRATAFGTLMGACLLVSAVFTELSVVGSRPTLRLLFNAAGCSFGFLYIRELRNTSLRPKPVDGVRWPDEE